MSSAWGLNHKTTVNQISILFLFRLAEIVGIKVGGDDNVFGSWGGFQDLVKVVG